MKDRINIYKSLQCIWMASGVVDYKLCDREFDCDSCIFDKSMRNIQHQFNYEGAEDDKAKGKRIIQDTITKIECAEFNSQYIYFGNHLVAKNLFANTYYLGFSPVAINILDNFTSFEYCNRGDKVTKGDPVLKVSGSWGSCDISSPINFSCLGQIAEGQNSHEKWFCLIEAPKDELLSNTVPVSDYHRDIISITKELTQFQKKYPEVGVTLLDGGVETHFLHQVIGNNKYLSILNTLFHKK